MKQCPIQIVDDNCDFIRSRWITLLKDIDHKSGRYLNINPYNTYTSLDKNFFMKLFNGINCSQISPFDTIRNPTLKEFIEISNAARKLGIKINLKTGKYIGKLL
jgi:hypothetical protein